MILEKYKFCIASKSFPLKFFYEGYEHDTLDDIVLRTNKECLEEIETYDTLDNFQILPVRVTYEF